MIIESIIIVSSLLFIGAIVVKSIRKAIGLLFVILGVIECLSLIGLFIGIPSVLIGGILLFS